jgi:hypothetical protein
MQIRTWRRPTEISRLIKLLFPDPRKLSVTHCDTICLYELLPVWPINDTRLGNRRGRTSGPYSIISSSNLPWSRNFGSASWFPFARKTPNQVVAWSISCNSHSTSPDLSGRRDLCILLDNSASVLSWITWSGIRFPLCSRNSSQHLGQKRCLQTLQYDRFDPIVLQLSQTTSL